MLTASPRPSTDSVCGAGIGAAVGTVEGVGVEPTGGAIEDGRFFRGALLVFVVGLATRFADDFGAVFFAGADGVGLEAVAAGAVLVFLAGAPDVTGAAFTAVSGAETAGTFDREPIFSARDFFGAAGRCAAAGLALAFCAGVALGASAGVDVCAEIRKSSIDVPRFLSPCLSQAGFGPRPLQV